MLALLPYQHDDQPLAFHHGADRPITDARRLIGSACRVYCAEHGLDEALLTKRLAITPDRLRWLQVRTLPDPAAPSFPAAVRRLARAFHCDAGVLLDILRCLDDLPAAADLEPRAPVQ